jgi:hypothetical protein
MTRTRQITAERLNGSGDVKGRRISCAEVRPDHNFDVLIQRYQKA